MAVSSQFDTVDLKNLDFPYDRGSKELDEEPRIVDGIDVWVALSDKIRRRPGLNQGPFSGITPPANRIDRLLVYHTIETPAKVFLVASVATATDWEIQYLRIDDPSPPTAWTTISSLREVNNSTRAHEMVIANGLVYILGFPSATSGEKLGSVIFDGTDESITFWGALGSTVPAKMNGTEASWGASTNTVTVVFGWLYSYSYKTKTGHITNRAPRAFKAGETSDTGAFTSKIPEVNVEGIADITNIPTIVIWRTTDGGGNYVFLDEIPNTGLGTILYKDTNRAGPNILDRTEELDNAAWPQTGTITITANSTAAPDGTTTAETLDDTDTDAGESRIQQDITSSSKDNEFWTASLFIKEGTALKTQLTLRWEVGTATSASVTLTWSDLTLVTSGSADNISAKVTSIENGWKRLEVTGQNNATGNTTTILRIHPAANAASDIGTVFAWGAQLETGQKATTYESNVTRGEDPKTDLSLDIRFPSPSLTSNSPPPRVLAPDITGVDLPTPTTPLAFFANRIWFGIGNFLFFSGQEEIVTGNPLESFPSGLTGNFFQMRKPLRHIITTDQALYVATSEEIAWVRGFDRASFQLKDLISDMGAIEGQPTASTALKETAIFLTQDYQIVLITGVSHPVSFPLGSDLKDRINAGDTIHLTPHVFDNNIWVLVSAFDGGGTTVALTTSRTWCFDILRNKWNPPWKFQASALVSGIIQESDSNRQLIVCQQESTTNFLVTVMDETDSQDDYPSTATGAPAINLEVSLMRVATGNHLNELREPAHTSNLFALQLDRTKFSSDTDPTVEYRLDEFGTVASWTTVASTDPPYRTAQSTSYKTQWHPISRVAQRAAIKLSKASGLNEKFELQTIGFVFQPEAVGA